MATTRKGRPNLEDELRELSALSDGPWTPQSSERLRGALRSPSCHVVARAARIVKERLLEGFSEDLATAFRRFLDNPIKTDRGCAAKLAAIEALDATSAPGEDLFLAAARLVQKEPSYGGAVDTAALVRARAVLALANLGFRDLVLVAAELLADPELPPRQAAAEALQHCGDRSAAGLLLLMSHRPGEDPVAYTTYLGGLLALAPDWGLPRVSSLLHDPDRSTAELAAIALGQSGLDEAASLLIGYLESSPLSAERVVALRGLGLHRSERALGALLEVIREGPRKDAQEAVKALSVRRFEAQVRDRVEAAARANAEADLGAVLAEAFPRDPD